MRYKKHIRHPFTDTPRKRAAVLRRQQRERDAFPLFAEEIAADQEDVDQVMSDRERHWLTAEIKARSEARGPLAGSARLDRRAARLRTPAIPRVLECAPLVPR